MLLQSSIPVFISRRAANDWLAMCGKVQWQPRIKAMPALVGTVPARTNSFLITKKLLVTFLSNKNVGLRIS